MQAELAQSREDLGLRTSEFAEARGSLDQLHVQVNQHEQDFQHQLSEAHSALEEANARARAEIEARQEHAVAEAKLAEELSKANEWIEHWVGKYEKLEVAHTILTKKLRADVDVRVREEREDLETRIADLKRERAALRRRLEQQRCDITAAEMRWKQSKEDAVREERERCSKEQKRAIAEVKARFSCSLAIAKDVMPQDANPALLDRSDQESREADTRQIAEQEALLRELRWELQLRNREIDSFRCELSGQDHRALDVQGFAPPLPDRRFSVRPPPRALSAGRSRAFSPAGSVGRSRPASAGRSHSAERGRHPEYSGFPFITEPPSHVIDSPFSRAPRTDLPLTAR